MVTSKVILASCQTQLEVYNDHSDNAHNDNDHVNEPDIDLGTKSFAIVHFNSVRVGHFIMFPTYGAFSHDVTEAIFVFLNKEWWPSWCSKQVLWQLSSFLMKTLSFVLINLN